MSWQQYTDSMVADPNVDRAAILMKADGQFVASSPGFTVCQAPFNCMKPSRHYFPVLTRFALVVLRVFECSPHLCAAHDTGVFH